VAAFYMWWIRDLGQNGYGPTDGLHERVEDVPSNVFLFFSSFLTLYYFCIFYFYILLRRHVSPYVLPLKRLNGGPSP
jgi:hypothetical protein